MKRMATSGLLAFVISLSMTAAQSTNTRAFFFPIEAGAEALVYEYREVNDPGQVRFLHLSSMLVRGETVLTYRWFNQDRQLTEMYTEQMNEQGRTLLAYVHWQGETMRTARPLERAPQPWSMTSAEFFQRELAFDANSDRLLWSHQLVNEPAEVVFNNEPLQSIRIREQRQFQGRSESLQQEAIYAQGLGLFAWTEPRAAGSSLKFQLHQIIDHATWEATQLK